MTEKFRIESFTIQGFRGFSQRQTLRFNGKSIFVLGPNNFGKSSICEAMMWCLFGERPNDERKVRNTFYEGGNGEVYVELVLRRDSEVWQVVRRLRPGRTESEPHVLNHKGERLDLTRAFPNLTRLAHGAGANIIYASQATDRPNVRDLKSFEKAIADYLGLQNLMDVGSAIMGFLTEAMSAQKDPHRLIETLEEVTELSRGAKELFDKTRERLSTLEQNPPWPSGTTPSIHDTNERMNRFFADLSAAGINVDPPTSPSPVDLMNAIQKAETRLDESHGNPSANAELDRKKTALSDLHAIQIQANGLFSRVTNLRAKIQNLISTYGDVSKLDGRIQSLEQDLQKIDRQRNKATSHLEVLNSALRYCETFRDDSCPVCQTSIESARLIEDTRASLESLQKQSDEELKVAREKIQDDLTHYGNIRKDLLDTQGDLVESELKLTGLAKRATEHSKSSIEVSDLLQAVQKIIEQMTQEVAGLEDAKSKRQGWHSLQKSRFNAIRAEVRYLILQEIMQALSEIDETAEWRAVDDARCRVVQYLERLWEIADAIKGAYSAEISAKLPIVNRMVEEVYRTLTGQRSFEKALIVMDQDGEAPTEFGVGLRFMVSSTRDGTLQEPETVLNEQALNALQIIPYFVFAKIGAIAHEFEVVNFDDPSRSYDPANLQKLLSFLAEVEKSTQIIVASPETDKFREYASKYFPRDRLALIILEDFNIDNGPKFRMEP